MTAWVQQSVALLLVAAVAAAGGCAQHSNSNEIRINGHTFTVEIADSAASRSRGLMFRDRLDKQHGMLFVFDDDAPRSFWMRDTSIPLSIAFIRRDGTITEIYDMQPYSLEPVNSRAAVRYALEVNQSEFRELGIRAGDRVELPPQLR